MLSGSQTLFLSGSCVLGFWYARTLKCEHAITVIFAVFTGSISLGHALQCLSSFAAGREAANKMFETVRRKPLINTDDTTGRTQDDIKGDIEFKHVCFTYPDKPNEMILDRFSLSIQQGKITALVGQSGSGKSAVISLIERFYDPQEGIILIDGINLKEFQLMWIREKIGLLSQDPVLFASSIKDNILYGRDGATDEDIRNTLELANATEFVNELPQGIDTMVGTQLTWDQRYRVAIARLILKNPRILLLEEVTGVQTGNSERIVQEALDKLMVNRTTVVVTHSLSMINKSDMIAVVHQGRVVEQGSHSDLVQVQEGQYCQLIKQQDINTESGQHLTANDQEIIRADSERHPSSVFSVSRSSSFTSSGIENSSHTLSVASDLGLPAETNSPDVGLPIIYVPFLRFTCHLFKAEPFFLTIGVSLASIGGAINYGFGWVLSSAINSFYNPVNLAEETRFWVGILMGLGVLSYLMQTGRSYFFSVAGCKLENRVKSIIFEKVTTMDISWFDEPENSVTAINASLSTDPAWLRRFVEEYLPSIVENIASLVASLIFAFSASWQLALILLLMSFLFICNWNIPFGDRLEFRRTAKKHLEEVSQIVSDAVDNMGTVASLGAEKKLLELYKSKCESYMKSIIEDSFSRARGFGLSFFILFISCALVLLSGVYLNKSKKATPKGIYDVFAALIMAAIALAKSGCYVFDLTEAKGLAESLLAILDRKPTIDTVHESGTTLDSVRGEIEFCRVSFEYPSKMAVQVFTYLNLTIQPGKVVALVGESGSGKSTLIALLQRFYEPNWGVILLDGSDIKTLELKWFRRQIGLVSKEPILFNDTIRANIVFGMSPTATESEIQEAAAQANAKNFISSLPQGFDTIVGEGGVELTRSQKQRVAIARVIIRAPKILLLEEDPNTLNDESDDLQEVLKRIMVDRTTIVVAHRRSTIMNADMIAVIQNGGIVIEERSNSLSIKL